ncbi:M23 family metallopeptidase [Nocardia asteroides]|nr:M23 family metallopeptidase [Nocardia asteroides]UGT64885.1 M23 family metallopeptidase [Nocardia asteroides]
MVVALAAAPVAGAAPPPGAAPPAGAVPSAGAVPPPGAVPSAAALADAAAGWPGTLATEPRFDWPLRPRPAVLRVFDNPAHDWLPGHRGVDLGGAPGSPVLAPGDAIVVFAGTVAGRPVVSLRHDGGLRTTYEPVEADVAAGARVTRGSPIGTLTTGHEGCPAPACLHWGARRDPTIRNRPQYVDPLGLLRLAPLRLKPLVAP